jgi:large subunit ribosomal protein L29
MDIKELRQKSKSELESHLLDLRKEQFSLRMQKGAGQLSQPHHLRRVRREIAQVKTLLGAKN